MLFPLGVDHNRTELTRCLDPAPAGVWTLDPQNRGQTMSNGFHSFLVVAIIADKVHRITRR